MPEPFLRFFDEPTLADVRPAETPSRQQAPETG